VALTDIIGGLFGKSTLFADASVSAAKSVSAS